MLGCTGLGGGTHTDIEMLFQLGMVGSRGRQFESEHFSFLFCFFFAFTRAHWFFKSLM